MLTLSSATTKQQPPPPTPQLGLNLDSLPYVDMTTLTQSELHALSLCSPSAFDLRRTDDIVVPTIDRSLFNESAGSRRQTYSRPRSSTTTTSAHHHRHRIAGLLPSPKPSTPATITSHHDPERPENRSIIGFLKQSLSQNPEFDQIEFTPPSFSADPDAFPEVIENALSFGGVLEGERKRKRGRKPKVKVIVEEREMGLEIVNKNGIAVDTLALGNVEDPYGEELRRRTEGLVSEEDLLGFMRELGGQWCSRRRKRKIVDADVLGDALPIGWKLLLGLRRREGRASVYCRRYISPGGQQFVSCKEVSGYLQSYFGFHDAQQTMDLGGDSIQQEYRVPSESCADVEERQRQPNAHKNEVTLFGIDNLAEVQIHDLFECHKCNMTFDEKDTYLQHLLSFHQRTTRRYRLGSSVGDGVIVKDGKFECQFCHKVFHERRRYNGHVGIHVRNFVRGIDESPGRLTLQKRIESPTRDELPTRISKMDALIEIAQNSILETSSVGPNDVPNDEFTPDKVNVVCDPEVPASTSDCELNSDSTLSDPEMEDGMIARTLDQELYQQNSEHMFAAEKMESDDASNVVDVKMVSCLDSAIALSANEQIGNASETIGGKDGPTLTTDEIDQSGIERERGSESHLLAPLTNQRVCGIENNVNLVCTNTPERPRLDEVDDDQNIEVEIDVGSSNSGLANEIVMETVQQTYEEKVLHCGVSVPAVSSAQSLHHLPTFNANSDKGENEFCSIDQRQDNVTGFEELRLDEIEQLKFSFGTGQESPSLPEVPIDLASTAVMEGPYGSSVQFESEEVMLNVAANHQLTTVCVWCGMEFDHEAVDSEMQSDSVGYMCPTCKAKISGQLNVLDSGSAMNSNRL